MAKQFILKRTITEEYEYDRQAVLQFISENPRFLLHYYPGMSEDDMIIELFDNIDGSIFSDEKLFGQVNCDAGSELLVREYDD